MHYNFFYFRLTLNTKKYSCESFLSKMFTRFFFNTLHDQAHFLLHYDNLEPIIIYNFYLNETYLYLQFHCLGIREAFQSGDHEPWVFRGGLTADLLRLMPVDTGNDLFLYQYPDHPTNLVYKMRPYTSQVGTMVLFC